MAPQISFDEVKKHNNSESIWMVIHNDVYDVTTFLNEHPGGPDSLLEYAGLDGTQGFEEVGHSSDAREMMKKYKIGTLPSHERCKVKSKKRIMSSKLQSDCSSCSAISCRRLPKSESTEKSWRTYDGSSSSRNYTEPKSDHKGPQSARVERRVQSIVVPRERRPRGPPCGRSKLKWALVALAGAIIIGFVLKKYVG